VTTQLTLAEEFAEVVRLYSCSLSEVVRLRLNPRKGIPLDQWCNWGRLRGGDGERIRKQRQYIRYLRGVVAENERIAEQAKAWWSWWESHQKDPVKAGVQPLVDPHLHEALICASRARALEVPARLPASAGQKRPRARRKAGGTRRRTDLDLKANAAVDALEQRGVDWRPCDVARELGIKNPRSLTGMKDGKDGRSRVERCPQFMRRWQKKKARGGSRSGGSRTRGNTGSAHRVTSDMSAPIS
jgi:hypothetical protein